VHVGGGPPLRPGLAQAFDVNDPAPDDEERVTVPVGATVLEAPATVTVQLSLAFKATLRELHERNVRLVAFCIESLVVLLLFALLLSPE